MWNKVFYLKSGWSRDESHKAFADRLKNNFFGSNSFIY